MFSFSRFKNMTHTSIPAPELPRENPAENAEAREVIGRTREELSRLAETFVSQDHAPLNVKPGEVISSVEKQRRAGTEITPEQIAQVTQRIPYRTLNG